MSREVTDEMIRAGAKVYLYEVFYPEDIAYEEWGKASELTRKVLEAALSASPTRAQAASAEPVEWVRKGVCLLCGDAVLNSGEHIHPEVHAEEVERITSGRAAPAPVAAYREVTLSDAIVMGAHLAGIADGEWPSGDEIMRALNHIHAVIAEPASGADGIK